MKGLSAIVQLGSFRSLSNRRNSCLNRQTNSQTRHKKIRGVCLIFSTLLLLLVNTMFLAFPSCRVVVQVVIAQGSNHIVALLPRATVSSVHRLCSSDQVLTALKIPPTNYKYWPSTKLPSPKSQGHIMRVLFWCHSVRNTPAHVSQI